MYLLRGGLFSAIPFCHMISGEMSLIQLDNDFVKEVRRFQVLKNTYLVSDENIGC